VQGDGSGVSLRMQIPAALRPQHQERIKVRTRSCLDVFGRRAGERKIEQHEAQTAAATRRRYTNIVGLDVTMGDALLLKMIERLKEIFSESPVCTDNLNAGVAVMKSAQDGA
jgi:hypothetical protein